MCLGLLSHLTHPLPELPSVDLAEDVGGAILLSPWVTFDVSAKSFTTNKYKDMFPAESLLEWAEAFVGSQAPNAYMEPLKAPEGWWQRTPVGKLMVLSGEDEVFLDDIQKMGVILNNELPGKVSVASAKDAAHVPPLIDYIVGMGAGGGQTRDILEWLSANFST